MCGGMGVDWDSGRMQTIWILRMYNVRGCAFSWGGDHTKHNTYTHMQHTPLTLQTQSTHTLHWPTHPLPTLTLILTLTLSLTLTLTNPSRTPTLTLTPNSKSQP